MKSLFVLPFSLFLFLGSVLHAQELQTLCKLPAIVNESSGVEISSSNSIWTFNDSGGEAELYNCDTEGNLIRTLKIENAWNRDWEDMTCDGNGNMYIGNIGSNLNDSEDLVIFKIPNPDKATGDQVKAEKISYTYEDQQSFPPAKEELNFDCEAMFWHDGYIYLSSKNRTFPMATSMYRIPDQPGQHVAEKLSTFYTGEAQPGEHPLYHYWITAGDISPDGKKLVLLSGNKLFVFFDYEGNDFFGGEYQQIDLKSKTQKEAIVFIDNSTLYITDEYWDDKDMGGQLYKLQLED